MANISLFSHTDLSTEEIDRLDVKYVKYVPSALVTILDLAAADKPWCA